MLGLKAWDFRLVVKIRLVQRAKTSFERLVPGMGDGVQTLGLGV